MLENRDYMREPSFEPRRPVTLTLLIVNVVVFVLQLMSYQIFPATDKLTPPPTDYFLALSLVGLKHGYLWQLITFQFMLDNTLDIAVGPNLKII